MSEFLKISIIAAAVCVLAFAGLCAETSEETEAGTGPIEVQVSGIPEKVYDGTASAKGVTVSETEGLTVIGTYFLSPDAGTDIGFRVKVSSAAGYRFVYDGAELEVDGNNAIVPGVGTITPAPAEVVGDPVKEYSASAAIDGFSLKGTKDGIKIAASWINEPHVGEGYDVLMDLKDGKTSNYVFTYRDGPVAVENQRLTLPGVGKVVAKGVTPVWEEGDFRYTGEVQDTPRAHADGVLYGDTVELYSTVIPEGTEFRDVGEYVVEARILGGNGDYYVNNPRGYFQIDPAEAIVSGDFSKTYDGTDSVGSVTVDFGPLAPDSCRFVDQNAGKAKDILLTYGDGRAAGCPFVYTDVSGNQSSGRVSADGTQVLLRSAGSILPGTLTLTWSEQTEFEYTGKPIEAVLLTAEGAVPGDHIPVRAVLPDGQVFRNVGTYTFTAYAEKGGNYVLAGETQKEYTITERAVSLAGDVAKTYDGTNAFGGSLSVTGAADGTEVTKITFSDVSAGTCDSVVWFTHGRTSNHTFELNGVPGTVNGDSVTFPDTATIRKKTVTPEMIGSRFVQDGDSLTMFVSVSDGGVVCEDFLLFCDGTEHTGSGIPMGDSGTVTVTVEAPRDSDWTGSASVTLNVDMRYDVTVISDGVPTDVLNVSRGTEISVSDDVLTVAGTRIAAESGSDRMFEYWSGVPADGSVESDVTVTAEFSDRPMPELDSVSVLTLPDRTEYLVGEAFDPTGMAVAAEWSDGTVGPVRGYTYSPMVLETAGTVKVTVTYRTAETHLFVNVSETPAELVGIEVVSEPLLLDYTVGDTLVTEGLEVASVFSDGTRGTVAAYDVSPILLEDAGDVTVVVSYMGFSDSFAVNVSENVPDLKLVGIKVTSPPSKTDYLVGETLDRSGMTVTAEWSDGTTDTVSGYTVMPESFRNIGYVPVKVAFGGMHDTFYVDVTEPVPDVVMTGLTVTEEPAKLVYAIGERFDPAGMVLEAEFSDGTFVPVEVYSMAPEILTAAGQVDVTLSSGGFSATVAVTVEDTVPIAVMTGIEVTELPDRTEYVAGEILDRTGMVVTAGFSDGTFAVLDNYNVMPEVLDRIGTTSVTVSYLGFTDTFDVDVVEPEAHVTGIEVVREPYSTDYTVGERLDTYGLLVEAVFSDGSRGSVGAYQCTPSVFGYSGRVTVTVSWTGFSDTFDVRVYEPEPSVTLSGITVVEPPDRTEYLVGETFDPAGMIVNADYSDGSSRKIDGYRTSPALLEDAGEDARITVTYRSHVTYLFVDVSERVPDVILTGLEITEPPERTSYDVGERFDPAGMLVSAHYSDGTARLVADYVYAPSLLAEAGDREVTVSYRGFTDRIQVKVADPWVDDIVDVVAVDGVVSVSDAETAANEMDEIRAYDPEKTPRVTIRSEDTDGVTMPAGLLASVRDTGSELSVMTENGWISLGPESMEPLKTTGKTAEFVMELIDSEDFRNRYEVSLLIDGAERETVFGEPVLVTLAFELDPERDTEGLKVLHLNPDGTSEDMGEVTYSEVGGDGYVTFGTGHLSRFTVTYDASEATGDEIMQFWVLMLMVGILVLLVIAAYLLNREKGGSDDAELPR